MIPALVDPSPDAVMCKRLVDALGRDGAHRAIDTMVATLSNTELAALAAHPPLWMRPKQLPPLNDWRSWGMLTSRGWGKTDAIARYITGEVIACRAMRIGLSAQNETKTISVQVEGLIKAAPFWFRPEWHATQLQLHWPNGAVALAFTPEVPGAIRSENLHLAWLSEIQSWPVVTREEAYSNFLFATRVGYARTIWDATPKRAHPILKRFLARSEADPARHHVTRGTIYENPHLSRGVVADMEREYGGTQKGREELLGEMLQESDAALVRQSWIDDHRRREPDTYVRRVIGIDPAVTNRAGNDKTGIVDAALGVDGQVYVCGDYSGKHAPGAWAAIVLEHYVRNACDCVVVETNKGGDLVTQNLRAEAPKRGLVVVVIGKDETPHRTPGTVYVRETHARGTKEDRAQPLSTAYERGRVSHVLGSDLRELEETITTWEPTPGQRSPDALDALVHATSELLGLAGHRADPLASFRGLGVLGREVAQATSPRPALVGRLAAFLGGGGSGRI
jgi:phage terminase large subunit-like protein